MNFDLNKIQLWTWIFRYQLHQSGNCNPKAADYPSLEKITRGDCIVCKDSKLLEADIDQIKTQQEDLYVKNHKLLQKIINSTKEKTWLGGLPGSFW